MSVSCECCVLSCRGVCIGLITRPEYTTEGGVSECDCEASLMRPWPTRACCVTEQKNTNRRWRLPYIITP